MHACIVSVPSIGKVGMKNVLKLAKGISGYFFGIAFLSIGLLTDLLKRIKCMHATQGRRKIHTIILLVKHLTSY